MFDSPRHMTPMMPPVSPLSDLALDVMQRSAALGGMLHPISQGNLVKFLRLTNSYYSNLIEGHQTHPADIERANGRRIRRGPGSTEPADRKAGYTPRSRTPFGRTYHAAIIRSLPPIIFAASIGDFMDKLPEPMRRVSHPGTGGSAHRGAGENFGMPKSSSGAMCRRGHCPWKRCWRISKAAYALETP